MSDGYVPRIDYALRARLAREAGQDASKDPLASSFDADEFDAEMDAESTLQRALSGESELGGACRVCGKHNPAGTRFCAGCGVPVEAGAKRAAPWEVQSHSGQHHYHHHYHHHYFGQDHAAPQERTAISAPVGRDATTPRVALTGSGLSRAEAAVRKLAQDWAQACNTKHLDDLIELYATDALVMRPNVPPVRGTAPIRELFFSVLDAGLGEVEMDTVRVEILGDVAYEAGRCKMLVPTPMGKRREERGKYLIVSTRQAGEWKIATDSWSSDLSLDVEPVSPRGRK